MKRTLPLLMLVGVVGLLVPVLAAFGESPLSAKPERHGYYPVSPEDKPSCCVPCCPPVKAANAPSDNNKVIDELTTILKETKSAETFIVTAMVLGRMGPDAKRALPIIIRNAERLELFEDLYKANASAENRAAAQEIVAALDMILDKKAGAKGRIWGNQAPACYAPVMGYGGGASSGTPVCPAPTSGTPPGWNAPAAVPPPPAASSPQPVKPAQASTNTPF